MFSDKAQDLDRASFAICTKLHNLPELRLGPAGDLIVVFNVLVSLLFYIGTSYLMMYILAPRTFNLVVLGLA